MKIGDWSATRSLSGLYREIRELGLETNLAELEAFGFTIIENVTKASGSTSRTAIRAGAAPANAGAHRL